MKFYRVYLLNRSGGIEDTQLIGAASDRQALTEAQRLTKGVAAEIWDQRRLVGTVMMVRQKTLTPMAA